MLADISCAWYKDGILKTNRLLVFVHFVFPRSCVIRRWSFFFSWKRFDLIKMKLQKHQQLSPMPEFLVLIDCASTKKSSLFHVEHAADKRSISSDKVFKIHIGLIGTSILCWGSFKRSNQYFSDFPKRIHIW